MEYICGLAILAAAAAIPLAALILLRKKPVALAIAAGASLLLGFFIAILLSGEKVLSLLDGQAFIGIFLFAVPLLFVSGRAEDFALAFAVTFKKKEADAKSLKKASLAVRLMERLAVLGATATFMVAFLSLLNNLEDLSAIRPNLALALLPFLYAAAFCALLKAVRACVDAKIAEAE